VTKKKAPKSKKSKAKKKTGEEGEEDEEDEEDEDAEIQVNFDFFDPQQMDHYAIRAMVSSYITPVASKKRKGGEKKKQADEKPATTKKAAKDKTSDSKDAKTSGNTEKKGEEKEDGEEDSEMEPSAVGAEEFDSQGLSHLIADQVTCGTTIKTGTSLQSLIPSSYRRPTVSEKWHGVM
jgi:hypothetical protein